jgi:putative lipoic acid-binding regulatory protein
MESDPSTSVPGPDGQSRAGGDPEPQLEITYPCRWEFRVIGVAENALRAAVAGVLAGRDGTVALANRSATGKYCSLMVEVLVHDEDTRLAIQRSLHEHPHVRMVF